MTDNNFPSILPAARRGSKRGWHPVTGEITPAEFIELQALVAATGKRRTDLVAEAVREYLARHKRRQAERRTAERRKPAA